MGQSPFSKKPAGHDAAAAQRRSTRIEFEAPIIFIGRDASGQAFREETRTLMVNLHGAKLLTTHQVMVGMQVGVENPRSGLAEEAVCVWVGETPPGQTWHEVAIQLLNPGNSWGVQNPPEDWKAVAEAAESARQEATAAAHSTSGAAHSPDVQYAQLMESVLKILRNRTDEIVNKALRDFEARLKELVAQAETRLLLRAEKALTDTESSLDALRRDTAEQLMTRTEQVVDAAEDSLRSKVSDIFSTLLKPSPDVPPYKK